MYLPHRLCSNFDEVLFHLFHSKSIFRLEHLYHFLQCHENVQFVGAELISTRYKNLCVGVRRNATSFIIFLADNEDNWISKGTTCPFPNPPKAVVLHILVVKFVSNDTLHFNQ